MKDAISVPSFLRDVVVGGLSHFGGKMECQQTFVTRSKGRSWSVIARVRLSQSNAITTLRLLSNATATFALAATHGKQLFGSWLVPGL